jgi:hypothetical protein
MRLEATVPDSRGFAVQELADQLGLSRSQIIDEALSLFLKAVLEIRQGRRLITQDPRGSQAPCELTTPTLTTLEWALSSEELELPEAAREKMRGLVDAPAKPSERLRAAARRHGR